MRKERDDDKGNKCTEHVHSDSKERSHSETVDVFGCHRNSLALRGAAWCLRTYFF